MLSLSCKSFNTQKGNSKQSSIFNQSISVFAQRSITISNHLVKLGANQMQSVIVITFYLFIFFASMSFLLSISIVSPQQIMLCDLHLAACSQNPNQRDTCSVFAGPAVQCWTLKCRWTQLADKHEVGGKEAGTRPMTTCIRWFSWCIW